jgi:exodeoxyribonuclease VII small subunit
MRRKSSRGLRAEDCGLRRRGRRGDKVTQNRQRLQFPPMTKKNQTPPKSFEDALAELERLLAEIEGGEIGLEESLLKYERGNFLIQHCRQILGAAEKQIEMLNKPSEIVGEAGAAVIPADDDSDLK